MHGGEVDRGIRRRPDLRAATAGASRDRAQAAPATPFARRTAVAPAAAPGRGTGPEGRADPPPVLFIDIDGVLLPGRHHAADANAAAVAGRRPALPWAHLVPDRGGLFATECCPQVIAALNALLARTGARMVLISTWRRAVGAEETRQILTLQGLTDQWHDDFAAPWRGDKGDDIVEWLAAHRDVTVWAVIDDDAVWPADDPRCGRHVRPDFHAGPQAAHWRWLEARLTGAAGR